MSENLSSFNTIENGNATGRINWFEIIMIAINAIRSYNYLRYW